MPGHERDGAILELAIGDADGIAGEAIQDLQDSLARSPLPFTEEQRQRIAALMLSGDPAPESTSTP